MLEEIDGRGVALFRYGGRLIEEVVGEDGVGIRIVDPGRSEAPGRVQAQGDVVADLAGESDALAFRKEAARCGAVDDEDRSVRIRQRGSGRIGPDLDGGARGLREASGGGAVDLVDPGGGVGAGVENDDTRVGPRSARGIEPSVSKRLCASP